MAEVTFSMASDAVRQRLGTAAFAHSARVATTAGELARAYGVDERLALIAGVLHDWDREQPAGELLAAARDAGIESTPDDEAAPYLLHAKTAAAALRRDMPGLPPEVFSAVERHTLGAVDMSDLDMIVYLADMIEPDRYYPGVDELRAEVGVASLPELFALGYQHSIAHVVETRRRIHPETVAVWNALVAGGVR